MKKSLLACVFILCSSCLFGQSCPAYQLGYTGGREDFCESDSVYISLSGTDISCVDRFRIDWFDNSGIQEVFGPGIYAHKYDLNTPCGYETFFITAEACTVTTAGVLDCGLPISLRIKVVSAPTVNFSYGQSYLCTPDSEITLTTSLCPDLEDFTSLSVNGSLLGGVDTTLFLPDTGCYVNQVIAETYAGGQLCGVDTSTHSICKVSSPVAIIDFPANRNSTPDTFKVCVGDTVCFYNGSRFSDSVFWFSNNPTFWNITTVISQSQDSLCVVFNQPNYPELDLVAFSSTCEPDTICRPIIVVSRPTVSLTLDTTICNPPLSLNPVNSATFSQPTDYDISWTFSTNPGSPIVGMDPGMQNFSQTTTITLRGENECRVSTATGQVIVTNPGVPPRIEMPAGTPLPDTFRICRPDTCIELFANVPGGNWGGNSFINQGGCLDLDNPGVTYGDTLLVTYGLPPCIPTVSIWVVVEGPAPDLDLVLDSVDCDTIRLNPIDYLTSEVQGTNQRWWTIGNGATLNRWDPGILSFDQNLVYDIVVKDSGFCGVAIDSGRVRIDPPGKARIQDSTGTIISLDTLHVCIGDGSSLPLSGAPSGLDWELDGVASNGMVIPSSLTSGLHLLTFGSKCNIKDSVYIEVLAPNATYTLNGQAILPGDTARFCFDGGTQQFAALPGSGTWAGVNVDASGNYNPSAVNPGLADSVSYTFNNGVCSFTQTFYIRVTEPALNDIVQDSCTALNSSTTRFCLSADAASSYDQLNWRVDNASAGTGSQLCTSLSTGSHVVEVILTLNGCNDTLVETFVVTPPAVAAWDLTPGTSLCSGNFLNVQNLSTGGNGAYEWIVDGVVQMTDTTHDLQVEVPEIFSPGMLYLTLVAKGGCGDNPLVDSVLILPSVQADFGREQDSARCAGDTVRLLNNSLGVPDFCQWILYGPDSNDVAVLSDSCNFSRLVLPPGDFELELITGNGCRVDSFQKPIHMDPPNVAAHFEIPDDHICLGDTLFAESYAVPANAFHYWKWGDGALTYGVQDPDHLYQHTGEYPITMYVRGCGVDSFTQVLQVDSIPVVSLSHDEQACEGEEVSFEVSPDTYALQLDRGDGPVVNYAISTYAYPDSGLYQTSVVATDPITGCRSTVSDEIEIYPKPEITLDLPAPICEESSYDFSAAATACEGCVFNWWVDSSDNRIGAPVYTFRDSGESRVGVIAVSAQGCRSERSQAVDVWDSPETNFALGDEVRCEGDPFEVFNLTPNPGSNLSFCWMAGGDTVSKLADPLAIQVESLGTTTILLEARNDLGCANSYSLDATLIDRPEAQIQSLPSDSCSPMRTWLWLDPTAHDEARWAINGAIISTGDSLYYEYQAREAPYEVVLTVGNMGRCYDTDTVVMNPVLRPEAGFVMDDTLRTPFITLTNRSQNATHYQWLYPDGELYQRLDSGKFVVRFEELGVYPITLIAFNGAACSDTTSKEKAYFLVPKVLMPNAFTPNNDGINDEFLLHCEECESLTYKIFNRWGKLIFEGGEVDARWDGKYKGNIVPEGVYVVHVYFEYKVNDGNGFETRTVTLIR